MNKELVFVEHWESDKGNREDHYYLDKNREFYLFGYNPVYINKDQLRRIMEIIDEEREN